METGGRVHSPNVPSNNCLNLSKRESSDSLSDGLRCLQLSLTMAGRSAYAYLASKISTMRLVAPRVLAGSWLKLVLSFKALEMLVLSCRLLIFLMGKRISSMVIVFSLKSNTTPRSCKVCLPRIKSYAGGTPLRAYSTISRFR
jgi:hypothetical protein